MRKLRATFRYFIVEHGIDVLSDAPTQAVETMLNLLESLNVGMEGFGESTDDVNAMHTSSQKMVGRMSKLLLKHYKLYDSILDCTDEKALKTEKIILDDITTIDEDFKRLALLREKTMGSHNHVLNMTVRVYEKTCIAFDALIRDRG